MQRHVYYKFYPAFHFLMPELSEVRRYAKLFVRMGLVRSEGGDYVPACAECVEYLDEWATVGMVFLVL
jgi:hypothetical protein